MLKCSILQILKKPEVSFFFPQIQDSKLPSLFLPACFCDKDVLIQNNYTCSFTKSDDFHPVKAEFNKLYIL